MSIAASDMSWRADLSGRQAFVAGASSGLGAHFAKVLAAAGASVVLAARRQERIDALVSEIEAFGGKARSVAMDILDPVCVARSLESCGPIDILVNSAGVTHTRPVLEQTEEDWDRIIDTNLKGAWLVATAAAKAMRSRGVSGSIINVASILGLRQGGQVAPYAISKAGMIQLTKQLALELARYQIRVNALAPGYIATELNRDFFSSDAGRSMVNRIPQRRLGTCEDLDGPLLLLASDASRFMTGSVLVVDGGHLLLSL